jgi:hypothetical protein
MSEELSAHDVGIVRDAFREIEAEPPPKDWGTVGVWAAVVGGVVLVGVPLLARGVPVPRGAVIAALIAGAAMVVLGVVARASAGGFARGRSIAAAEAALRHLESDDPDRETALRAATLLLVHAYAMYGPKPSASFDFLAGRRRSGRAHRPGVHGRAVAGARGRRFLVLCGRSLLAFGRRCILRILRCTSSK